MGSFRMLSISLPTRTTPLVESVGRKVNLRKNSKGAILWHIDDYQTCKDNSTKNVSGTDNSQIQGSFTAGTVPLDSTVAVDLELELNPKADSLESSYKLEGFLRGHRIFLADSVKLARSTRVYLKTAATPQAWVGDVVWIGKQMMEAM